ncbi:HD domain-containing protein, partial [Gammaproteobacteria bacterium]|nr:HD domain-containing protein [Gammaproteobacteria bacterium]
MSDPAFAHLSDWGKPCLDWLLVEQPFDAAHDLSHLMRVTRSALRLGQSEGARIDVLEPAAWLHDCVIVPKNSPQRSQASTMAAEHAISVLASLGYPEEFHADLRHAIEAHSYSANITPRSIEAAVLRDADRLDALGAIGIYRVIAAGVT